jgi:hypothetical protein
VENPPPAPPQQQHFLFVTNPIQGHINPTRRLAGHVMKSNPDARVTFCTAVSGHRRIFTPGPDIIFGNESKQTRNIRSQHVLCH